MKTKYQSKHARKIKKKTSVHTLPGSNTGSLNRTEIKESQSNYSDKYNIYNSI